MISLSRPPTTDEELWWLIKAMFGIELPRVAVCDDHVSPFDAVAHAFFGREPNFAVWYASRGSGKSLALAVLGLVKAFVLDIDVTILGGSMTQSLNVREHMRKLMAHANAPMQAVSKDQATLIQMHTGKSIKPLPASQTTVRGPHPPLQLLDEVDEMEKPIYDASLGQAMEQLNAHGVVVEEYIVASSTWQNPEGCGDACTPTVTRRGTVQLQEVRVGDHVPTRTGWRRVSASLDMGMQGCVTVTMASGLVLRCTPWHPVWVEGIGFVRADALASGAGVARYLPEVGGSPATSPRVAAQSAGSLGAGSGFEHDNGPLDGQVVSVIADCLGGFDGPRALIVDGWGDRLEVARVDAGAVRTGVATRTVRVGAVAEMVQVGAGRQRANDLLPDPAVRRDDALGVAAVGLDPVAVAHNAQRPLDAVIGVEIDGYVFAHDEVVHVSDSTEVLPTWDLTVEDCHEYVAGGILVHNTFTQVMEDARERGLPIFTWCWRELLQPHGWMSQRFIDSKRKAVSAQMWHTEYELNEPNAGSRAIDLDKVEAFFVTYPEPIRQRHEGNGDYDQYVWADPEAGGLYAVGADWAKEQDKTVIIVMRYDVTPHRVVKLTRVNRRPWDTMIAMFNADTQDYQAVAEHDGTGIGNVINDFVDFSDTTRKFVMVGRPRTQMLLDYITAFEHHRYELPLIPVNNDYPGVATDPLKRAHRSTTVADVYAPGKWNSHLPDDMAAIALCHRALSNAPSPATHDGAVPKQPYVRDVDKPFHVTPDGTLVYQSGDVTVVEDNSSFSDMPFIISGGIGPSGDEWAARV